ncbi:hypothetical protein GCM10010969_04950 [Saccharibacillus kuerlensis]|uniref:DUF58 domain-containing protein n=1 Tax=Saccharibacillus kuerlensis TaxID=459527 RepID=A0ABQ2KT74_9BACL|nr:hypothetical protein GCM10010969_04950 [Saccharibacillus kuerlensis]
MKKEGMNLALFWMIFTGILLAVLQAQLIGRFALRGVRYSRRFDRERCHAGEDLELIEVIENDKKLPIPWLRLESEFPSVFRFRGQKSVKMAVGSVYQTHTSGFALMPRRRVTRRHFITCEGRGIFKLSTVFMTAGDLLGFMERSRSEHVGSPLIVYPKLLDQARMPYEWRSWQGEFAVRRWIMDDPFMIEGSREYAPGDPMNRIDWKASARTGGLQVYRQGHSADPYVMIVLDIGQVVVGLQGGGGEAEAEHVISLAATCASQLIADGVPVGFTHNAHTLSAQRIPPGGGSAHHQLLMEAMAGIRLHKRRSLADCLIAETEERGVSRDYIVITSADSTEIRQASKRLERLGHKVVTINPVEAAAPPRAREAKDSVYSALRKEAGA